MEFDFPAVVEAIDKVPEDFRGLYLKDEKENKFKLGSEKPEIKSAVAAIAGLNAALRKERDASKALRDKAKPVDLTPLADYGQTPEEIAAKIKEIQAGKPNAEKIKAEFAKEHAKEIEVRDKRVSALTGQLHAILVDGEATKAIAAHKGIPDLLLPFVRSQVKVFEEDGRIDVRVVDSAGEARYSGVTGKPMSVPELVQEMKAQEKYGRLFDSEAPKGGGTSAIGRVNPQAGSRQERTPAQKIAAGLDARVRR